MMTGKEMFRERKSLAGFVKFSEILNMKQLLLMKELYKWNNIYTIDRHFSVQLRYLFQNTMKASLETENATSQDLLNRHTLPQKIVWQYMSILWHLVVRRESYTISNCVISQDLHAKGKESCNMVSKISYF